MASGEASLPRPSRAHDPAKSWILLLSCSITDKGAPTDSQWIEDLSEAEEFSIFDLADQHDLSDPRGNLYGIRRGTDSHTVIDLGTEGEQVAKFLENSRGSTLAWFPDVALGE